MKEAWETGEWLHELRPLFLQKWANVTELSVITNDPDIDDQQEWRKKGKETLEGRIEKGGEEGVVLVLVVVVVVVEVVVVVVVVVGVVVVVVLELVVVVVVVVVVMVVVVVAVVVLVVVVVVEGG